MDDEIQQAPAEQPETPAPVAPPPPAPAPTGSYLDYVPEAARPKPPPAWDDVKDDFAKTFPKLDPGLMEKQYNQARDLGIARQGVPDQDETGAQLITRKSVPFLSTYLNWHEGRDYTNARDRFQSGRAEPGDAQTIAEYEHLKQADAQAASTTGGAVGESLLSLPAIAGEFAATGGMSGGASLLGRGAALVARTAATPSLYVPAAVERSAQQGGDWSDPKNLAPAFAYGVVQNLIFGSLAGVAGGISNPAARFIARVGIGTGEMEGAKIAAGAVDEFLPEAYKIRTRYGAVGDLIRGDAGDALKELVTDAATMAVITAIHGNPGEAKKSFRTTLEAINSAEAEQPPGGGDTGNPGADRAAAGNRAAAGVRQQAADVLGVDVNATPDQVQAAYREAVKRTHPDRGGKPEDFHRVQWAYDLLNGQARGSARRGPPPSEPAAPQQPAEEPPPAAASPGEPPEAQQNARPPEDTIRWKQPVGPDEPPVADGMIRMYHGGVLGGKGGRDFTPDRTYAEAYAAKTPGAEVGYIDLPRNSPLLTKAYDDTGTSSPAPPVHLHATAELAESMKPLKGGRSPDPVEARVAQERQVLTNYRNRNGEGFTPEEIEQKVADFRANLTKPEEPALFSPASPREEADRLEAQHKDLVTRAATARKAAQRAQADLLVGIGRQSYVDDAKKSAAALDRQAAEVSRKLDDARSRAAMAEAAAKPDMATLKDFYESGQGVDLDEVFDAKDLNQQERHVTRGILDGRAFGEIGAKLGVTKQRVEQIAKAAAAKVGLDQSFVQAVHGRQRADVEVDKIADGKLVDPSQLKADPETVARRANKRADDHDQQAGLLEKWADFLTARGKLTASERADYERRILAGEHPPGQGPGAPAEVAAAPVVRGQDQAGVGVAAGPAGGGPPVPPVPAAAAAGAPSPAPTVRGASVRSKPLSPFEREWTKRAAAEGISFGDLSKAADQFLALNAAQVDDHNAIVRRAVADLDKIYLHRARLRGMSGPGVKGFTFASVRALAGKDETSIFGLDGVAQELAETFGRPDLDPAKLFEMLQEGIRPKLTKTDALEHALNDYRNQKDAEQAAAEAIASGASEVSLGEAIRSAEEDGQAEGLGELRASAGDADESGFAGGDVDFDPAEFAGPGPADPARDALRAAVDWLKDDSATFTFPANLDAIKEQAEKIRRGAVYVWHGLGRLAGQTAPSTTALSREAGESVGRFLGAKEYVRLAAGHYGDLVLGDGPDGKPTNDAADEILGAAMTERRLRWMRQTYLRQGDRVAASKVKSIIGAQGSPLKTLADYKKVIQSSRFQDVLKRYVDEFVPVMEENYRAAQGLGDQDPINSQTQIPGQPVNLKPVRGDEDVPKSTAFIGQVGNLRNTRARKLPFAHQATGTAEAYDISLRNIITNTLARGVPIARQAEMYRTLEGQGLLKWTREGQGAEFDGRPGRELPNVRPPRGTQAAIAGQTSAYVHPDAYGEVRAALKLDEYGEWSKTLSRIAALPTAASLASTVEVATHGLNLLGGMFSPAILRKVGPAAYQRLLNYPKAREGLMALADMNAVKPPGVAGGTVVEQANRGLEFFALPKLPENAKYADPTYWGGKVLHAIDDTMRLAASAAYDALAANGLVPDTATGKRDFINQQFGQYNAAAQNGLVKLARATGIGPFATAGTTFNMRAIRAVFGGSGAEGMGLKSNARLRAEVLGKLFGMIGLAMALNYARHKRWDGAPGVPYGAVYLGKDGRGKDRYVDTPASLMLHRGLRAIGLDALLSTAGGNQSKAAKIDKGTEDVLHSWMHPFLGPAFNFAWTAATGEDSFGHQVAQKPVPGGWGKHAEDLKAAVKNANPAISSLAGFDKPTQTVPWSERWLKWLGPFRPKTAAPPAK